MSRPRVARVGWGTHWSHRGLTTLSGCTVLVCNGLSLVTSALIWPLIGHYLGLLLWPSPPFLTFCWFLPLVPSSHTSLGPSRSPDFFCSEHRARLLHQWWLFGFRVPWCQCVHVILVSVSVITRSPVWREVKSEVWSFNYLPTES